MPIYKNIVSKLGMHDAKLQLVKNAAMRIVLRKKKKESDRF